MRATITLLLSLAMALTALGLAFAAPGDPKRVGLELQQASGAVHIANSRDGQAVFSAAGMRPGEGVSGTVRIGNDGDAPGAFSVRPGTVQDIAGTAWRPAVDARRAGAVRRHRRPAPGHDLRGAARRPPGRRARHARARQRTGTTCSPRRCRTAACPGSALAGDNLFQGSSLSLGFEWRATSTPVVPTPTPTPMPVVPTPTVPPTTPTTPTAPTTPTTPTVAVPTGAALADALGLPPARACVSRRKFTIRLKAPLGASVVSATITINGKVKARVKGGKTRAPVDLRGLPMGKVKVNIATKTSDGRTYKSTRTYRTCGLKKVKKPKQKSKRR